MDLSVYQVSLPQISQPHSDLSNHVQLSFHAPLNTLYRSVSLVSHSFFWQDLGYCRPLHFLSTVNCGWMEPGLMSFCGSWLSFIWGVDILWTVMNILPLVCIQLICPTFKEVVINAKPLVKLPQTFFPALVYFESLL